MRLRRAIRAARRIIGRSREVLGDINVVAAYFGAETRGKYADPAELDVASAGPLLVFAPHQDDETIGAGGVLLLARDHGAKTSVVFVTDGAMTDMGVQYGATVSPETSSRIRMTEGRAACRVFGAEVFEIGISNLELRARPEHVASLADCIRGTRPRTILVPWLFDANPKHRLVNHLLWLAHRKHGLPDCTVWGYQIRNALLVNGIVDITEVFAEKMRIMALYASQNDNYRRYDHMTMGMNAWNSQYLPSKEVAPIPRYAEVFCVMTLGDHLDAVRRSYLGDLDGTYLDNRKLSRGMGELQRELVGAG
jgi:LmbE family N-acetylglucosaminyl deacetylase